MAKSPRPGKAETWRATRPFPESRLRRASLPGKGRISPPSPPIRVEERQGKQFCSAAKIS